MKTASEVAEEIVGPNIDGNKYHDAKIKLVAQALTAFREEGSEKEQVKGFDKGYQRGRAEALEEAAKFADDWIFGINNKSPHDLPSHIRALKEKP